MARITRFVLGPLLFLGGLWIIALPFGFATLSFGGRDAPPGWGEYLGKVFTGGVSSMSIGLIMVIGGIYLASTRGSSSDQGVGPKKM